MRLVPRLRHLRIVVQALFLAAFAALFAGLAIDLVPGWVASLLLSAPRGPTGPSQRGPGSG